FWLAGTLPPAQSRLRTTSQDRRNHGLSGHDSAHAQTAWLTKNDVSNRLLEVDNAALNGGGGLQRQPRLDNRPRLRGGLIVNADIIHLHFARKDGGAIRVAVKISAHRQIHD